jgi:hypothetical protein
MATDRRERRARASWRWGFLLLLGASGSTWADGGTLTFQGAIAVPTVALTAAGRLPPGQESHPDVQEHPFSTNEAVGNPLLQYFGERRAALGLQARVVEMVYP